MAIFYDQSGISPSTTKIFNGIATVGTSGEWEIDFSHVGFNNVFNVQATPEHVLDSTDKTPTGASITFHNYNKVKGLCLRGVSAGLLLGVANLWALPGTKIHVTVTGH